MLKSDFEWHITFERDGFLPWTMSEKHPYLKEIKDEANTKIVNACLVDMRSFSLIAADEVPLDAIVHSIPFENARLKRIFRRTEIGLITKMKRVIPAIEYSIEDETRYLFAFPDKVILTKDLKYYRED